MRRSAAAFLALSMVLATMAGCSGGGGVTSTATATRADIAVTVSVSGNLDAPGDRLVSFIVPGTVKSVLVKKGDTVKSGDVLAQLETTDLQRNVDIARAHLAQAQAQYNVADQQLRATIYPNYYGTYVVDIPSLWKALDDANAHVEEVRALADKGNITEANAVLNQLLADIDSAKYSSEARTWDLPAQVKAMQYQRDVAAAAVTAADLALDASKAMLDDATITAPIAGMVASANVKEGDVLTAANLAAPAFRIVDPSHLDMTGLIDEVDVAGVKLGQDVDITLDALPGVDVSGTVTFISDAALIQAGVVLYPTTITLNNPDPQIKDGMSATADIIVQKHTNVLIVPAAAIFKGPSGGDIVYLVGSDDKPVSHDVTTGLRSGRDVEVVSGLQDGDRVSLQAPA